MEEAERKGASVLMDQTIKDFYQKNGAALLRGVFSPEQLELLARGIEKNVAEPSPTSFSRFEGEDGRGVFTLDYGCHRWIPEYIEFAATSRLSELAAELLQSKRVCFFDDSYFIKQAGSEIKVPWHHDFTYYEIEGDILVAWIPLDSHGEHETLRLVAGSHRWGKRFPPVEFESHRDPASAEVVPKSYDPIPDIDAGDYEILSWEVEPGDCVFFNGLTLHSSRGNPTQSEQRRFNCRFVDESAVYVPNPDFPLGDGKANANVQPGQRLSEDPEHFPVLWQADTND